MAMFCPQFPHLEIHFFNLYNKFKFQWIVNITMKNNLKCFSKGLNSATENFLPFWWFFSANSGRVKFWTTLYWFSLRSIDGHVPWHRHGHGQMLLFLSGIMGMNFCFYFLAKENQKSEILKSSYFISEKYFSNAIIFTSFYSKYLLIGRFSGRI